MLSFWRLFAQKRWKLLPSGYLTFRHGQFIDGVDFPWLCQITRWYHFLLAVFFSPTYRFEEVVENHHVGFYRSENDLHMLGFPHLYDR